MNNYEDVPFELKLKSNWVCVKNGSKCPFCAHADAPASSTNTSTWASFEEACEAVNRGKYDGIGYCFDGNGIVGIDIDDGFDADGFLTEKAARIIDAMHSYTEISRSGRGFHIFVKGQIPFSGRNNQKGTEMYSNGRYFITTGRTMFYAGLIENQKGLDWVVETYFPEMIHKASAYNRQRRAVYEPFFCMGSENRIPVKPNYPDIPQGCRNVSMLSLAGSLMRAGMTEDFMEREMRMVNETCCHPPLSEYELRTIIRQARKYR